MRSMTGFGRASLERNGRNYIIEIKTVNNKYNDISIRLPRSVSFMEEEIRKYTAKRITRGKTDITLNLYDYSDKIKKIVLNKELAKDYINQLKEIAQENNVSQEINVVDVAKLPDICNIVQSDDTEEIQKEIIECLEQAIDNLLQMRTAEGENIKHDLEARISRAEQIIEQISADSTGLIKEYVVKLKKRVTELLEGEQIDENRIAEEAVIYADKTSIEEELTRLNSHTKQFREIINANGAIGKKLDFLIQEMNRETNTIGAKSGSNNITKLVIDMKVELEDIREQIQNIE